MNSFWLIEDYIFANDFLVFLDRSFKKRKKSCFWKLKKVKYVFSNTAIRLIPFHCIIIDPPQHTAKLIRNIALTSNDLPCRRRELCPSFRTFFARRIVSVVSSNRSERHFSRVILLVHSSVSFILSLCYAFLCACFFSLLFVCVILSAILTVLCGEWRFISQQPNFGHD